VDRALLHLQQIYSKISLSGCKPGPIARRTTAPSAKRVPLFSLFLQEIISERPLLHRRNPRLSETLRSKKQRDDARIPVALIVGERETTCANSMK
jgi:hypothetical protein